MTEPIPTRLHARARIPAVVFVPLAVFAALFAFVLLITGRLPMWLAIAAPLAGAGVVPAAFMMSGLRQRVRAGLVKGERFDDRDLRFLFRLPSTSRPPVNSVTNPIGNHDGPYINPRSLTAQREVMYFRTMGIVLAVLLSHLIVLQWLIQPSIYAEIAADDAVFEAAWNGTLLPSVHSAATAIDLSAVMLTLTSAAVLIALALGRAVHFVWNAHAGPDDCRCCGHKRTTTDGLDRCRECGEPIAPTVPHA